LAWCRCEYSLGALRRSIGHGDLLFLHHGDVQLPGLTEGVATEKELGGFFWRVDNLVWIKNNSYDREVLEDCKERKKSLGEKLD
jgi:hypothetical protein